MPVFVPAVALFGALVLVLWMVLTASEEKSSVRATLRSVAEYDRADVRRQELQAPLVQRVLRPFGRSLVAVGRGFMPAGYMDGVRRKLLVSGRPGNDELDRFRAIRVLTVAALPVAVGLIAFGVPGPGRTKVVMAVLASVALVLGPDAVLNRKVAERRQAIRVRLPDVIDLLTISVEAGLGFDQALDRTVAAVPGPLSEEFARMLGELRAGAGRADALRNVESRTDVPELRSFLLALIQAETFGVSVGRILRAQADEIRIKRRQLAQEEAQKAPVKLLFPMVFCIFPGIFVVLIGPAILNFINSGF